MTETREEMDARLERERKAAAEKSLAELHAKNVSRAPFAPVGDTSGDKSRESLAAEASGSDGTHALSNETPGKQGSGGPDYVDDSQSKLTIERFVEPVRTNIGGRNLILTDDERAQYEKLMAELATLQGNRQLGDLPLSHPYWAKQNEITVFVANLAT